MKTAMIFGTFDILHYGHLQLLKQARRHCDHLIAVVARDTTVAKVKGAKPFHTEKERLELLRNLKLIDMAILGQSKDMYAMIRKFRPEVICLGYDQKIFVPQLKEQIKKNALQTKIVRLKPYKPTHHKTSRMKAYLDANL